MMHRLKIGHLTRGEQLDVAISRHDRVGREHVHACLVRQCLLANRAAYETKYAQMEQQEEAEPVGDERPCRLRRRGSRQLVEIEVEDLGHVPASVRQNPEG